MERVLINGNEAAAWAARLSKPQFCPIYPITPQTGCIEALSAWKANGELPNSDVMQYESEHSVISAGIAASATGSRVFTATSSQGLLLMTEMMYICSGLRLPIVMCNVSRAISAPISLWPDHMDFLGCRDMGWIMLHCKNNQEILDYVIMAYKIAEHPDVLLPVLVNYDGYTLSFTEEPVDIPDQEMVDIFLGVYQSDHNISPDNKLCVGAPVMAEHYSNFRIQQFKAMENSRDIIRQVFEAYGKLTGRFYGEVDFLPPKKENNIILITQGSMSTTAKFVAKKHNDVGVLNLPIIRPLPSEKIRACLASADIVAVLDRNVAPGKGGIMISEIKDVMYHNYSHPRILEFIVGLGGVPQTEEKINLLINKIKNEHYNLNDIEFNDVVKNGKI